MPESPQEATLVGEVYESVPALKLELNLRRWDTSGFTPTRVAYVVLLDSDTNITKHTRDHRWVFLESEDWFSRAYARSTTDWPLGLPAPERIHSSRHLDHICRVLTRDAAINFIEDFQLTPAPKLNSKIQLADRNKKEWESRLQSIAERNSVCIEPDSKKAEIITICAIAERY
jgi:hypothetical protein